MRTHPTDKDPPRRPSNGTRTRRAPDVRGAVELSRAAMAAIDEFGADAVDVALAWADAALEAGDGEAFQTWLDVAGAIQETGSPGEKIQGPASEPNGACRPHKNV